jgi:hypothetical protein
MAFHSGFSTQRAERTWKQKLDVLASLGFIDLKAGPSGPYSYALLLNPYLVIKKHYDAGTPGIREDKYNALVARALEVSDKSFSAPAAAPAAALPGSPPINPFTSVSIPMGASPSAEAPTTKI